jgi:hypothetical protein
MLITHFPFSRPDAQYSLNSIVNIIAGGILFQYYYQCSFFYSRVIAERKGRTRGDSNAALHRDANAAYRNANSATRCKIRLPQANAAYAMHIDNFRHIYYSDVIIFGLEGIAR